MANDRCETSVTLDDLRAAGFKVSGKYRNAGHYACTIKGSLIRCQSTPGLGHLAPAYQRVLDRLAEMGIRP